jgi:endonuclease/exonuclease/phosphatase family metal-dependent hydrolase
MKKIIYTTLACLLLSSLAFSQNQLRIGTYNVRNDNKADSIAGNGWQQRYPVIGQLIQFNDLDIFGTQEAKHNQLNNMLEVLPGYKYLGIGRDDGKVAGEFSAIFYKVDKFKVLKQGDFWLSPITDRPNKGWDAALPRLCTWAQFQDIKTGFKFFFFNLHMDHIGVQARKESVHLVLAKIKEMAPNQAAIFTGDFNVDQRNESYAEVLATGVLKDTYDLAPVKYAQSNSFNAFKTTQAGDARIDHIFVTKQFDVKRYAILTDTYGGGRLPSDHYPVVAIMNYK